MASYSIFLYSIKPTHKPVAYDPSKGEFVDDDADDEPNEINASSETYQPGAVNADSIYPAEYISNYGGGTPAPPTTIALPKDTAPPTFVLTDGQSSSCDILYRMREQACQNKCEIVQGIPGNIMAAKKQGDNGCEYAAKISPEKELYMSVSGSGQNCYDATERTLNTCWTDMKNDAGWIIGPNYGEFYQAGVRN